MKTKKLRKADPDHVECKQASENNWDNWVIFFQLLYFSYHSFYIIMIHIVCFFICIVNFIYDVVNVLRISDDGMEIKNIPLLSRMSVKKELHNRTTTTPIPHSVTSIQNSSIPTTKSQAPFSKSLLFFSPDIHDGTTTDLAVSLTSQNHSVFYNGKGALPAYTGLRSKTLSEKQYLQLSGTNNNKSRIVFASPALCRNPSSLHTT